MRILLSAAATAVMLSGQAMAAFDLQITELFGGIEPGENLTDDWFEVTNFGDMAFDAAVHGDLYYDDESADPNAADLISGVTTIAPGESVIFVDGGPIGQALWETVWAPEALPFPQIGTYEGSGISNDSEDGAALFIDSGFDGPDAGDLVDLELQPNPNFPGSHGRSYDPTIAGFSPGAPLGLTTEVNDEGIPQRGSPGFLVPEPTSIALFGMGLAIASLRRK